MMSHSIGESFNGSLLNFLQIKLTVKGFNDIHCVWFNNFQWPTFVRKEDQLLIYIKVILTFFFLQRSYTPVSQPLESPINQEQ